MVGQCLRNPRRGLGLRSTFSLCPSPTASYNARNSRVRPAQCMPDAGDQRLVWRLNMRTIFCALALALSLMVVGCPKEPPDSAPPTPAVEKSVDTPPVEVPKEVPKPE